MPKKRRRDGKITTDKGGRPVDPQKRRQQQAEVVRLRSQGLTYQAIADRLRCSTDKARTLAQGYWQSEIGKVEETADHYRRLQTEKMDRLIAVNMELAMNPKIVVEKDDPEGGTMKLEDFEKVVKASKIVIAASAEIAKLNGCYRPQEVAVSGTLSMSELGRILEASAVAKRGK